jgi:hypothetical protein
MDLYLSKEYTGLNFDIKYDPVENKNIFVENVKDGFVVGTKEFEEISKLYGINIPNFPPEKYINSYRNLLKFSSISNVPWRFCIPEKTYFDILLNIAKEIYESIKNIDLSYYEIYKKGQVVINSLKPAKIDKDYYNKILLEPNVESFKPGEDGFTKSIVYDRTQTVTGRLKIVSGPNILNLKKEYRKLIVSRFGTNGSIYYLDFISLEPRLLLTLTRNDINPPKDIYEFIKTSQNLTEYSRSDIKNIVISELYGSGISSIKERLPNITEKNLNYLISAIKDYFQISKLKEKLLSEYEKNNKAYIKNYYGRRVSTLEIGTYALINRFIQSSAVDVALLGFSNIISTIKELNFEEKIVPIFILHDGIFFDIHKDFEEFVPLLAKTGSKNILGFENKTFYINFERIF